MTFVSICGAINDYWRT